MNLPAWYHEDPAILHVGTEENRSYYIPFKETAEDRRIMLSGNDWAFRWFRNYLEVPQNFTEGVTETFDTITVPSCVNILGYERHQYANVRSPIPFDPPYVPAENPCGAYVKHFTLHKNGYRYYLNFEGVDSCFYLWAFFWSLAYVDWYQDKQPSKEEAFKKLLGRIHPGAIVLLHNTSSTNGEILDELLAKWEEMGYTFSTLKKLVRNT